MSLVDETRVLLEQAASVFADGDEAQIVAALRRRLDQPLRVAVAGKVKAGKSTLLNALVGELLAPTDAGECTKVVTWYRDGHTYEVLVHPSDGSEASQARFRRDDDAIEIDLAGRPATDIDRIEVTWPSTGLRTLTLIDTPGVDSLTEGVATRSFEFLEATDDDQADAVLYLMKHIHSSDLRLLEAFHDDRAARPDAVNAIAVLSRADEIGVGRPDSMDSARRIAARLGDDHRLRRLVQTIVPVAGLLGETARTLREGEYRDLVALAAVGDSLDTLLLSADRFVEGRPETPLTSIERGRLLDRLGLFGVRTALDLIATGEVATSTELAVRLADVAGLDELRRVLSSMFVDRADVLKARSGLTGLERLCESANGRAGVERLAAHIERVLAGAHEFNELSTLAALRSGWIDGPDRQLADLERLLGATGTTPAARLALDADAAADPEVTAHLAVEEIGRWQRLVENPLTRHDLATAMRVAIRSLESIAVSASVADPVPVPPQQQPQPALTNRSTP